MSTEVHHFKVGAFEWIAVSDGINLLAYPDRPFDNDPIIHVIEIDSKDGQMAKVEVDNTLPFQATCP